MKKPIRPGICELGERLQTTVVDPSLNKTAGCCKSDCVRSARTGARGIADEAAVAVSKMVHVVEVVPGIFTMFGA